MKYLLVSCLLVAQPSIAGNISDTFSDGVFSTRWGLSCEEVQNIFPKGEKKDSFGITQLTVRDNREVFGIDRSKKATIVFSFDPLDRLNAVTVNFTKKNSFPMVLLAVTTHFGQHINKPNSVGVGLVTWPIDEGLELALMGMPSSRGIITSFSIAKHDLAKPGVTKEELGF